MQMPKPIPRRTQKKTKQPARCVDVVDTFRLTPNMQRVVLSGEELRGFPPGREGANFKIIIPDPGQSRDGFAAVLNAPVAKRVIRTFTIAGYDPETNRLTVDFALHDGAAPAGDWAKAAGPGAYLGVTNGGDKKVTDFWGTDYLLASDMTGLPAMAAILADMPDDAKGTAFFEITHPDDAQDLAGPAGVEITWLVHPNPNTASTAQIERIRALAPPDDCQVAAVGEHSVVADLKRYFFAERGFDPGRHYLSPYWKIGLVEEEHQALKRAEA